MLTLLELSIDIYNYLDSRSLIRDYCQACKAKDSKYSQRFFAKKLGFGAPNYIKLITDGSRNISENMLDDFSQLMGLKGNDKEYFELLVRLTQATDIERRNHYFQQISSIRRKKLDVHKLVGAQFDCISSLLHLLIREMSFLPNFEGDPHWIAKQLSFKVAPAEISRCLKDLEEAQLMVLRDGKLKAADSSISFPDEVRSLAIQNYHHGILDQAKQALQQPLDQREYGATLVATTPDKFKLVKDRLKKFRAEIMEILDTPEGKAEEVVVLSFQMFHVVEQQNNKKTEE